MHSLCQDCFSLAEPTLYFPWIDREGVCCSCGEFALIARVPGDRVIVADNERMALVTYQEHETIRISRCV